MDQLSLVAVVRRSEVLDGQGIWSARWCFRGKASAARPRCKIGVVPSTHRNRIAHGVRADLRRYQRCTHVHQDDELGTCVESQQTFEILASCEDVSEHCMASAKQRVDSNKTLRRFSAEFLIHSSRTIAVQSKQWSKGGDSFWRPVGVQAWRRDLRLGMPQVFVAARYWRFEQDSGWSQQVLLH